MKKRNLVLGILLVILSVMSLPATNYVLNFDGTDDYVNIPDNNSLNSNSFTIELWLKPGSLRIQHLVTKQDPGGGGRYWRIFMASANGSIEFDAIPGEIANCNTGNIAQVGEWIHIAAVYDHAASTVKLYADGVLKSEVTGITDMGGATDEGLTFSKSYSPLDGCLDEVRYWNIALTEEQIRENMYLPLSSTETGLVSYWQFNDGSGTTLTDNLNTNDGTLINMTDDDWISSSIPFGPGYADTETEANGTVNFNNTGLSMYFNLQNGAEITVTRIDTTANVNPSEPETVFDEQYWVVNRFGTGSFNTDITFTISEDLTAQDESYPTNIKLYTRDSNADTNWEYLADAISVNAAINTAAFSGISSFSQFLVTRDKNPQVTLYEPFNFDLVTNNFNSIDVWDYATPAFTDFDGDRLLDMIVGQIDGNLNYYEQDAENSTSFTLVTNNFNSIFVIRAAPTFTDLDGDGLLDLMVGENYGHLYHYEQDSENSTSFTLVTNNFNSIDVGSNCKPTFTDIDGDGLLDLIAGEDYGHLYHYEQDSENSTSFSLVTNNFNSIDVGLRSAPTFTDLDGDGILDMIVGEGHGSLYYYKQDSENSTSFSLVANNFNSIDVGSWSVPTFTYLDGDGLLDLMVGKQDGTLSYYEQHGIDTLDFAKRLIGLNAVKSYYLKASDLINDLDINCSGTGFSISQSENSGYSQNLTITPANGIVFDIIFVKFSPTQENSYTGNIEHTSNGAQTQSIVLSGTGCSIDNFPGNALDFDGIDDYVNIGNDHSLNVGNTLTIEAWVKPNSLINQYGIFSTGIDNRAGSFQLEVGPGNGGTNRVAVTSPATWVAQTGDNAIIPNIWNHIVYTRSGTGSGTHKIYVNGEEQTLISDADYSFADNIDDKVIASATNGVQLFTGKIDEVRLWNIVRTESEIRENMYLPLSGLESGLVSYWQFNEGSETSASDLISGNYGTLTNMTVDDWISSSIPFGPGYTDTETETNGTVAFSNTGLSMNFSSQNGAEITVTRIDTIPNINPDISGTVFDSQYWVVNRYGNGSFDADLTFTISEDLTAEFESYNAKIKLYTRDSNADTYWEYLGDASSVSAADNTATFTGITSFSQFIIIRDDPQIYLSDPSDFELVTDNFSSIDVGDYATPAFTDLDGDRLLDMIVGEENGNLNYYEQDTENSTSFTLVTNSFNSINVGYLSAPAFTDLDGDGLLDMIVGEGDNLYHYEQDAVNSTSFTLVTNNFSSLNNLEGNSTPAFTDIDGDGLLDLIVGRWSPKLYHYEQNAVNSTSFTLVSDYFNSLYVGYNNTPTFTDVDGDGLLDLLVGDDYGRLHHFEQDSENSSSFSLVTDYLNSIDVVGSTAPTFTDLFGDGKLDLILGISNGKLYHYEQLGIDSLSFGNQSIGQNTVKSYTLRASDLINDLNINCSNICFSISLSENSGYSQSISITPVNGRVTEKIFVKFSPTQEITYTENIEHTSNRAQTQSIVLSGTGYRIDSFPGTALEFDGTDDYISGNGIADDFSAFTLEAWVYHNSLPAEIQRYITIAPEAIVLRYDGSAFGGDEQLHFYIKKADGSFSSFRVDNVLTTGEWMHITATYDGTDMKLYLNGGLLQSNNVSSDLYPLDGGFSFSKSGETLDGKMDEIRLWNRALSNTEIRENMNRAMNVAEAGLQYYWQFNEGTGSITDIVGGGLTAALYNMAEDDWIDSTIPFGPGYADTETEAIGVVNFTDTGLSMNFSSQNGAEITVTRIDTTANVNPTDQVTVFDEQYWVVNRYGTGSFDADLTFTISEDLTAEDESNPTLIKLYTRASNADTSWVHLKNADSVSSVNDEVTFNGITEFSQFIVGRWILYLDIPQNVIISVVSDSVYISWDSVNGANSYKIYASSDPYASDWGTEIASVSGTIWSADISGIEKKFYSVVASSEIVRNNISGFSNGSKVIPERLITPRKMRLNLKKKTIEKEIKRPIKKKL